MFSWNCPQQPPRGGQRLRYDYSRLESVYPRPKRQSRSLLRLDHFPDRAICTTPSSWLERLRPPHHRGAGKSRQHTPRRRRLIFQPAAGTNRLYVQHGDVQPGHRGGAVIRQRFQITNMHCTMCSMNIDGALEDLPGVTEATTSFARSRSEVTGYSCGRATGGHSRRQLRSERSELMGAQ